jgi:O-antigen/teichoic acid export membrane protein
MKGEEDSMPALRWREAFGGKLAVNSYLIMAMRLVGTLAGFVFWAAAARLVTVQNVGVASGAVAAAGLLSRFAVLGLGQALVRFLPESSDGGRLVNDALTVVGVFGILLTTVFLVGVPIWSPALSSMLLDRTAVLAFGGLALSTSIANIVVWVFVARRSPSLSLAKNVLQGLLSLLLLGLLAAWSHSYVMVLGAYSVASVVSLVIALIVFVPRVEPRYRFRIVVPRGMRRPVASYALSNYAAELLRTAPHSLLPLLVVNLLGPARGAYFFVAWSIAVGLDALANSISASFFAEGANKPEDVRDFANRSVRLSILVGLGLTAGTAALGRVVLSAYGPDYASVGFITLVLLAASLVPSAVMATYYSWLRLQDRVGRLVAFSAVDLCLGLAAAVGLMTLYGLPGIGAGWLISRVGVLGLAFALHPASDRKGRSSASHFDAALKQGGDAAPPLS